MASCPVFTALRTVNVSTMTQLQNAINAAIPGDDIVMAPGSYNLSGKLTITRNGTATNPIRLIGPRTAILNGTGAGNYTYLNPICNWWVFQGFKVQNGLFGIETGTYGNAGIGMSDCVVCDVESGNTGNGSMVLRGNSSRNLVQENWFHDTGVTQFWYGEGIYVGSGATSDNPANDNHILNNDFGPNVRADHVDVKNGTSGNTVEGNTSDATGFRFENGSASGGQTTESVYSSQGQNQTWLNNTINNMSLAIGHNYNDNGFFNWQGSHTRWHGNVITEGPFDFGIVTNGGTDNPVHCDNTMIGGTFSNVACTPVSGPTLKTATDSFTLSEGTSLAAGGATFKNDTDSFAFAEATSLLDQGGGGSSYLLRRLYGGIRISAPRRRYW